MSSHTRRVLVLAASSLFAANSFAVDYGRTKGAFSVSPSGAATYTIPIWTPPGPNGIEPSISLSYNSQGGNGLAGVGWNLNAVSSIERCPRTIGQDGASGEVTLTSVDRFCIGGSRLRLSSGTYGAAGSVYFTELADYSRITAFGTTGSGPTYFVVEAKSGLKYEYGNTTDSRVTLGGTVLRWMLNKVSDRSSATPNNYVVSYIPAPGFAVPATISWTPTSLGASTYRYDAVFNYSNTRIDKDSYTGVIAGFNVANHYRLESIQIKSGGIVKRKFRLTYDTSTVTLRSRMTSFKECADDLESNCFLPTAFSYQAGQSGITLGAATPPAGSSTNLIKGRYDFNGDGKNDVVYWGGSSWYVLLSTNGGFSTPYNTGLTAASPLIDKFLPTGRDALLAVVSGTIQTYRWDDSTSAFVSYNTGLSSTTPTTSLDYNGDGLADLVYFTSGSTSIQLRANTSTGSGNPSFAASTFNTAPLTGNKIYGNISAYPGKGLYRIDVNGDRRADLGALIVYTGPGGGASASTILLGSSGGLTLPAEATWTPGSAFIFPVVRFNNDDCTDRIVGSAVLISACAGTAATSVALPATPLALIDWDGDGKTDLLVNNGGTVGVYLSTGTGFSSLITTSVSLSGTPFDLDQDGDKQDDLIMVNGTSPFSYWTHTAGGAVPAVATNIPDLLSNVTDGFGVSTSPSYVSTAWSNYNNGTTTAYPLFGLPEGKIVASQVVSSDGTGGNLTKQYFYVGGRIDGSRGEDVGFQRFDETDLRNGLISRTYFEQLFPRAHMVSQAELMQPNGTTTIARNVFTNTSIQLDFTTNNQRYFPYTSNSTSTQYEVNGSWNGSLIRTIATADSYDTTSGTLYNRIVTTTEPASGANGVTAGGSWEAHTYLPLANMLNDTGNWCLGRPQLFQQINSSNLTYGGSITRTRNLSWDAAKCRLTQTVDELGSSTLQVTTDIGYDNFGNQNSTTVTGTGMLARTTTASFNDSTYTTGQFPLSVTNALGQTTIVWNYDLGVPASETDPNGLQTSWIYDPYGRRTRENRADSTYSTYSLMYCSTGCDPRVRMYVEQLDYDSGSAMVLRTARYFDQFDRSIYEYVLTPDGGNYAVTARGFDSLGRVVLEYFPYSSASSPVGSVTSSFDILNRPTAISRPISDSNSTLQTTNVYYEGLSTRVVDPLNKQVTRIMSAAGLLARSQDNDGYYQGFDYDAFGNVKRVRDIAGNDLQTSNYNIRGMLIGRTDMDMGAWSFTPDALGQTISQTDAKGQTSTFTFDTLGRLTSRIETEGTSYWTWGTSSAAKNIGSLSSVSGPGYSESYTYDSLARLSNTTVSADATYQIDYSYNSFGALDTLTYPTSTSSYRLKLQHEYKFGRLYRIKDYNAPSTVFWSADAFNIRDQVTTEGLGNGTFTVSAYDSVTGWQKSRQTGVGGGAGLQNLQYEWDLVGNLKKRKDLNQSTLTEEFFYDNVYRLDYSTLNGVTNLDMGYDALGNITSKSDVGTYTYSSTKKHQVVSTSNGWSFGYDANGNMTSGRGATTTFTSYNYPSSITNGADSSSFSYTPDRQYWQQTSNYSSGGTATTIYVGGLLEKVTTSAGTDYRHMIRAGSSTIIVSRQSAGTNSVYYVASDQLGSSSAITNSSGGLVLNSSFGAFGARRGSNWTGSPSSGDWTAIASTTRRGFTEHTMLDNLGLIHMNGRVQDPVVGRFISADPYIADPNNTQSYNRYSYVLNNPLSMLDPTGFQQIGSGWPGEIAWQTCIPDTICTWNPFPGHFAEDSFGRFVADARNAKHGDTGPINSEPSAGPTAPLPDNETPGWLALTSITVTSDFVGIVKYGGYSFGFPIPRWARVAGQRLAGGYHDARTAVVTRAEGVEDLAASYNWVPMAPLLGTAAAAFNDSNFDSTVLLLGSLPFGEEGAVVRAGEYVYDTSRAAGAFKGMCFAAGTPIRTERGLISIEDVREGDRVWSRNEATETESYQRVLRTFVTLNQPTLQLQVASEDGVIESVESTIDHPFWVIGRGWIAAHELRSNDEIYTAGARSVRVVSTRATRRTTTVYNFEVEGVHTYFVGNAGLWVHNASRFNMVPSVDALSRAAGVADRGGFTAAGRSLTKHGVGARAGNSLFPAAKGNPASINQQAQDIVDDILTAPGSIFQGSTRGRFGATIEVTAPSGRGIVYDANGNFLFFKE